MTHDATNTESTPVLIVGGGLAGLSAALFLSFRGVQSILIEKHPRSSPHPRAIGFTPRTLEIFRAVGIGACIPQHVLSHDRPRRVVVESLAGTWSQETAWNAGAAQAQQPADAPRARVAYSPCRGTAIAQDTLEPILREEAAARGADVRMNTRLLSFEQSSEGVLARVRHVDGRESEIRAEYMIAADGHASSIRDLLGIGRSGHGVMQVIRSVIFRAELSQYLTSGISQFEIHQPGLEGMLTTYGDGRWLLMFSDDEERDQQTLRAKSAQAIGRNDLEIELVTTGRWTLSALIADRFASGRVFLTGDAAHTLPTARGGYGANTGIEDSWNLTWKLAAVLQARARTEVLDTYDAERRPIAWLRHDQIFARKDYARWATAEEKTLAVIDDDAIEFGQLYRSQAVLGATPQLPAAMRPEQWAGQPGTRAPHLWLSEGELSTLDLLQRGWTLVFGSEPWSAALAGSGVELQSLRATDEVRSAFGLATGGAALVRPDGYIAWRTQDAPADCAAALASALEHLGIGTQI